MGSDDRGVTGNPREGGARRVVPDHLCPPARPRGRVVPLMLAGKSLDVGPGTSPRSPRRRRWLLFIALVVLGAVVAALLQGRGSDDGAGNEAGDNEAGTEEDTVSEVVLREDFTDDVAVGSFADSAYGQKWTVYPDGWEDTSGLGTYAPSRVLSVEDGALTFDLRAEDGEYLGAALTAGHTYGRQFGRFSIRWRADPVPGFGLAFLLWPDSERWPDDGEIDFPEGWLDGSITATAHHADPTGGRDRFDTGVSMTDWHVTTVEWTPSTVTFSLDERVVGTSTTDVPQNPMHVVLQAGTNGSGTPPPDDARGRIQVDWVQVDAYGG
jgi:beta-glucanase (GH16 family)